MHDTTTFNMSTNTLIVGARRWPAIVIESCDTVMHREMLHTLRSSFMASRVHRVLFDNGWEVSVIWGSMTWSSNNKHPWQREEFYETPRRVEAAVFTPDGEFMLDPNGEMVILPYLTPSELNALLDAVAAHDAKPKELTS